jgi:hypothetical protein
MLEEVIRVVLAVSLAICSYTIGSIVERHEVLEAVCEIQHETIDGQAYCYTYITEELKTNE